MIFEKLSETASKPFVTVRKLSKLTLMAPPPTQRLLVAPANQSFFTKEQVHRAVLCRQLHEFLGHPNDEALKTVLNPHAVVLRILRIMWRR